MDNRIRRARIWAVTTSALVLGCAAVPPALAAPAEALGLISTFAGTGDDDSAGDGGLAGAAKLKAPSDVAVDAAGNTYVADRWASKVRKIDPQGRVSTFAGTGEYGAGDVDGILAKDAKMKTPGSVAVDKDGNVYIADTYDARVRKVGTDGRITTVAGTGEDGFTGDGSTATARLNGPSGLALDPSGRLYIADRDNHRVRRVDLAGKQISTVDGTGTSGSGAKELAYPEDVAVDAFGVVHIADTDNNRVQKIDAAGAVSTEIGTGLNHPAGVTADVNGTLYLSDTGNQRIKRLNRDQSITVLAGTGAGGYSGDGGQATAAQLNSPSGLAVTRTGNLLVGDYANHRVRRVVVPVVDTTVSAYAGTGEWKFSGDGGPALTATFQGPRAVSADGRGGLFISDGVSMRVRKVGQDGIITTVAGTGERAFTGDGGPATQAALEPQALVAGGGGFYVIDAATRIRKVDAAGVITTIAGTGKAGYTGDGGPAKSAQIAANGLAIDRAGNLYFADWITHRVRRIGTDGVITTVAGTGTAGFTGDGGQATAAQLNTPTDLTVDGAGNVYIIDNFNYRIRKVNPAGVITTFAGTGRRGYGGPGKQATQTDLYPQVGLATDPDGNVYMADLYSYIHKIGTDGIVSDVAGTGVYGDGGDGGPATAATINPYAIALDNTGTLYFTSTEKNRVRKFRVY
ncbi:Sugar lactone lactonase YvrE [Amycolatopsis xylanica]|uniref:Sugar lactone lactonase YvrE n=1 Tax=Amycolatopsis xylanica TaxID=589385 RepID=A0A1H3SDF4_9PSEU|nr:hypothetical protein [Amycolatopsis xylanica]SDZ36103.1 Sugar lactone lactonase YvrE [Amycolatopsis xylanica]